MKLFKQLVRFFDQLEDKIRARLSRYPIFYALVGGVGVVLFWKGVWETAAHFSSLDGVASIVWGLVLVIPTGLFVSFFIGDNIILSGRKQEKKLAEQTESELRAELNAIKNMSMRIEHIEKWVKHIHRQMEKESEQAAKNKSIPPQEPSTAA